jgi:hypothetical protein
MTAAAIDRRTIKYNAADTGGMTTLPQNCPTGLHLILYGLRTEEKPKNET